MKNYRSVPDHGVPSKVLKKVVVNYVNSHVNSLNTSNHFQSAYWTFHSTKTALKIQNNILLSLDAGKIKALTLLDLSDAIDHTILLRRLDDLVSGY